MKMLKKLEEFKNQIHIKYLVKKGFFTYDEKIYNNESNNIYNPQPNWEWLEERRKRGARINPTTPKPIHYTKAWLPINYASLEKKTSQVNDLLNYFYPDDNWIANLIKINEEYFDMIIPDEYFYEEISYFPFLKKYKVKSLLDIKYKYNIVYHIEKQDDLYHVTELFCKKPLH